MDTLKGITTGGGLVVFRVILPALVAVVTLYVSTFVTDVDFDSSYAILAVLAAVLSLLLLKPTFQTMSLGESRTEKIGSIVFAWACVMGILAIVGYATKTSEYFSRLALFIWLVVGTASMVGAYYWLQSLSIWLVRRGGLSRSVVMVGINEVSVSLAAKLEKHPQLGLKVEGYFDDREGNREDFDVKLLGKLPDVPAFIQKHGIDLVFVAIPMRHIKRVTNLLDELHDTTASIYFLPDVFVFDLIQSQVLSIAGFPVVALCETPFYGYRGLIKRLMDFVLAAVALVVLSPLLIAIALAVRVTSSGSVVFRQRRYGLDGEEFMVYKFRTMRVSDDGAEVKQASRGDDRLTPIGGLLRKWSLDELPQLVNVLQGRMSLVGPRPHAVAHNEEYRRLIKGYMFRHKVLPGMTGWAQVNGYRGGTEVLEDMRGRVEHDLYYLRHWSVGLDIKILFLTVFHVFNAEKAY